MTMVLCCATKLTKGREPDCTSKNKTNPKESLPHTAHHPEVHYKINNNLQQLLYTNALQIPGRFEVTLQRHSAHTICLMKSQLH